MASSQIAPPPSAGVTRRHFLQLAGAGVGVLGFPFLIGVLLFSITFVVNLAADLVVKGIRKK
jgi:hypothetical protein